MIHYRKENPVLIYGDIEFIKENTKDYFIYKRKDENNEFLIEINLSDDRQKRIIDSTGYKLIFSNVKNQEKMMSAYEANLYRKI